MFDFQLCLHGLQYAKNNQNNENGLFWLDNTAIAEWVTAFFPRVCFNVLTIYIFSRS